MIEKWSEDQVKAMKELVLDGLTDREIAEAMNEEFGTCRTGNGIALARRRTGTATNIKGRLPEPMIRSQVLNYLHDGRSLKWIAEKRKVNVRVVWNMVRRLMREGLVERVGGNTRNARYRVTLKWIRDTE